MQVIMQNTVQSSVLFCRSCVVHGFDNSLHPPFAPSRWGSSGTGVALTPHGHTLLRAKPPKDGDAELQGTTAAQGRHVSPAASDSRFPASCWRFFLSALAQRTSAGFLSPPTGGEKGKPGESRGRKAPRLPHALRATPVEPPNLTQERICVVAPGVGQWPSRGSGCSRRANAHSVPLSRRRATQSCKSSRRPRASRSILTRHNSFSRTVARRPATASPSSRVGARRGARSRAAVCTPQTPTLAPTK